MPDRFFIDATHDLSILGSFLAKVRGLASVVAVSGGSRVLVDTYGDYFESGYDRKLVDYPLFDLRLLKLLLQSISSSAFGSLNLCSMMKFIVTRLNGAEHRDWMMSRSGLRRAIITGELSLPSLLEVVSNIVDVWSLIVVYLKETGETTNGDN